MNKKQIAHSAHIREVFSELQEAKYKTGAKEHGTKLYELDTIWLLKEALNEFIDGFTYVKTAIDQLDDQITIDVKKGSNLDKFFREMITDDYWNKIDNTTDKRRQKRV